MAHLWGLPIKDVVNVHGLPELHILKGRGEVRPRWAPSTFSEGVEMGAGGVDCAPQNTPQISINPDPLSNMVRQVSPCGAWPLISAGRNSELCEDGRKV